MTRQTRKRMDQENFDNIKRLLTTTNASGGSAFTNEQIAEITGYSEATIYRVKNNDTFNDYVAYMHRKKEAYELKKADNMPGTFKGKPAKDKKTEDKPKETRLDPDYQTLMHKVSTIVEQNMVIIQALQAITEDELSVLRQNDHRIIELLEKKNGGLFGKLKK